MIGARSVDIGVVGGAFHTHEWLPHQLLELDLEVRWILQTCTRHLCQSLPRYYHAYLDAAIVLTVYCMPNFGVQ